MFTFKLYNYKGNSYNSDDFFPGHYTFTVNVKSDSYLGVDVTQDIKLDVHEARDIPDSHVQWEFEDEDEDENSKAEESDDEFATDDDFDDDDD